MKVEELDPLIIPLFVTVFFAIIVYPPLPPANTAPASTVRGPLRVDVNGLFGSSKVVNPELIFRGLLKFAPLLIYNPTVSRVLNVPEFETVPPGLSRNIPLAKVNMFPLGFKIPPVLTVKEDTGVNVILFKSETFPELFTKLFVLE